MHTSDITIPASYARALMRAVEEQGHSAAEFVQAEGISASTLNEARSVSAPLFGRLYQRAILLLKDETLGMASGGRVPNGTFRMMCLCVIHCETLGEVLTRVGEFLDVCRGATLKPNVTLNGSDRVQVGFALVDTGQADPAVARSLEEILQADGPQRVRTSLFVWHNLLTWFAGADLPLTRVTFAFTAPDNPDSWERMFNCPVEFNQAQSAIEFPTDYLKLVNVQTEASLQNFLRSAPFRLIVPHHREHTIRDRVLAVLGDDFSRAIPTAAEVAAKLNLSVSTLRRHLSQEGTSFQQLKDECRYTAALRYLGSSELSLSDIAGLLGFDEVSAFFRAFKRWSGTTPAAYRRQL